MDLKGIRVAILVEQQYQEMEVWYPLYRLREAGCEVHAVGPDVGKTYPSKLGYPITSDVAAKNARLRLNEKIVEELAAMPQVAREE